jgi:5-methylcytosine-specific restriction endonuclease McrA
MPSNPWNVPKIPRCYKTAWRYHRKNCLRRGVSNRISFAAFCALIASNCVYCGKYPRNTVRYKNFTFLYQGIDRMDNRLGYVPGNVVACCAECNSIKGKNLSHLEMIQVALLLLSLRRDRPAR